MNRYELGQIKSIITAEAYKRAETVCTIALKHLPSSGKFCGSVNKSEFLTDDTATGGTLQLRRAEIDLEAQKTVNLEQVYAQCLR